MDNTSYVALSRATSLQRRLDIVAHNIANMNTVGYKKRSAVFSEFLMKADRPFADRDIREHKSVIDLRTVRDTQDGGMKDTGNDFDLALSGPGFFKVRYNGGAAYTRAGNFKINNNGELVTTNGNSVLTTDGQPIQIPPQISSFDVTESGQIFVGGNAIGKIGVVQFADAQDMEAVGDSMLLSDQEELPANNTIMLQGRLEESNVQPVVEMTRMIHTLRMFQANQNMIQSEHEREREAIRKIADAKI